MRTVQPVRSKQTIQDIKAYLLEKNLRDYLLFVLGVNTALRAGDILKLTKGDILKGGKIRDILKVRINKTGKEQRVALNRNAKQAIKTFLNANPNMKDYHPLFAGKNPLEPITRVQAWRRLQRIAKRFELEDFALHSLRKSWGFHARKQGIDISIIQEKLGHSTPAVTKRYIGITDDEVNDIEKAFCL